MRRDPTAVAAKGGSDQTALHYAARSGHLALLEFLLAKETDVDARTSTSRPGPQAPGLSEEPGKEWRRLRRDATASRSHQRPRRLRQTPAESRGPDQRPKRLRLGASEFASNSFERNEDIMFNGKIADVL